MSCENQYLYRLALLQIFDVSYSTVMSIKPNFFYTVFVWMTANISFFKFVVKVLSFNTFIQPIATLTKAYVIGN